MQTIVYETQIVCLQSAVLIHSGALPTKTIRHSLQNSTNVNFVFRTEINNVAWLEAPFACTTQ